MERLEHDLLFRRFVGTGVDDLAWDHSVLSKNRDRRLKGDIASKFLAAVPAQPKVKKLPPTDHFSVDGTLDEHSAHRDGDGQYHLNSAAALALECTRLTGQAA